MTSPTTAARSAQPGVWAADLTGCTAAFAVQHLRMRTVTGRIPVIMAELTVGPDGRPAGLRAELDACRIDTGDRRRDRDLRGPRFLATGRWPVLTYAADDIRPYGDGWTVRGTLTVRDTGCPVQLDVAAPGLARPGSGGSGQAAATSGEGPLELRAAAQFDRRAAGVAAGPSFLIGHLISVTLTVRLHPPA